MCQPKYITNDHQNYCYNIPELCHNDPNVIHDLNGVLDPRHIEYSPENKVYSFFWSWVYIFFKGLSYTCYLPDCLNWHNKLCDHTPNFHWNTIKLLKYLLNWATMKYHDWKSLSPAFHCRQPRIYFHSHGPLSFFIHFSRMCQGWMSILEKVSFTCIKGVHTGMQLSSIQP